jgi:hypothetical protein
VCKKSFTQRCNLITHFKVHTREQLYSSVVCKKISLVTVI